MVLQLLHQHKTLAVMVLLRVVVLVIFLVGGEILLEHTANTFANVEVYIPNYTSTNQKSVSADAVSEQNATTAYMALTAQLWSNLTTAITSISVAGSNWFCRILNRHLIRHQELLKKGKQ
jgi:hypothetical protein